MSVNRNYLLGFKIDKLTDSIINLVTGEKYETVVTSVSEKDLATITKAIGWNFNWKDEFRQVDRQIFKLCTDNTPDLIHGLISLEFRQQHVYMYLLESAPFNVGKDKIYEGVPGNLVAFACKLSFDKGYEGFVAFESKTGLIKHYIKTLGAYHFKNQLMIIDTTAARVLVNKYFKS